jgi:hypothetical protein
LIFYLQRRRQKVIYDKNNDNNACEVKNCVKESPLLLGVVAFLYKDVNPNPYWSNALDQLPDFQALSVPFTYPQT